MSGVFDVADVVDVPGPGRRGVVLTARADLDIASEAAARTQITGPAVRDADAVLLDLTLVFVGAAAIRCVDDATARFPAVALVGAPRWMADLSALAGIGPLSFARTVPEAVAALRAADRGPTPLVDDH
ncbi:hypothetical protein [Pseudonocardia lacus]|jgi:hypothetical protein|uniref:hypothetical protein n=1 Tax=Pseudonocardia lacus TaxID=2835865 RepID=UPI001BDD8D36|nr:hypothetical protein [Pseudonocardia lacus]